MRLVRIFPLLGAGCLVCCGYLLLPGLLPPRAEVERDWDSGPNWFGQPSWTSFPYAVGILVVLCVVRFLILRTAHPASYAVAWYCLALAVFVPAIWLLVVIDWDNEAVSKVACWVGYPISLLVVPSVLFCVDLRLFPSLSAGVYAVRSVVEMVILVPTWLFLWIWVELLFLGWWGP